MRAAMMEYVIESLESLRLFLAQIPGLATPTSAPYLFRPFLLLFVLALIIGPVATIVNLRRLEFNAEAMVHSVFPGIVVGAIWGGSDAIIPGAALTAIVVALALTWASRRPSLTEGGAAVILTGFFSIGIIISLKKGDMSGQLEALMFGRLLEVTDSRLLQALFVCFLALILMAATWKEQIFVAHDRHGAKAAGLNTLAVDIVINAAVGAVVVSASTAVGVLLVIGYLVVPGAAARLLGTTSRGMVVISTLVALSGGWIGIEWMNTPSVRPVSPQAAVSLSLLAVFLLCLALSKLKARFPWRKAEKAGQLAPSARRRSEAA